MRLRSFVWKELWERPTAMLTSLLAIVLGVTALVAIRSVTDFSEQAVARELDRLGANLLVLPKGVTLQDYYVADLHGQTLPESHVSRIVFANLRGVENLSPKLCVPATLGERSVTLTGILPQSEFQAKAAWGGAQLFSNKHVGCKGARVHDSGTGEPESLARQRTIQELRKDEVLLGADVAEFAGLKKGGTVKLLGKSLRVLAILPATGTVDDGRIFAHLHTVQQMSNAGEVVNVIEIMGCCEDAAGSLVSRLGELLPDTKVVTIAQVVQTQVTINRLMTRLSMLFLAVLLAVGGVSMASAMYANVTERRREIGTLMALGATPAFVARLFLAKACLLGLSGGAGGYVAGTCLAMLLGPQLAGIRVQPIPVLGLTAVAMATFVTLGAAYLPARRAARLDPCLCFKEV